MASRARQLSPASKRTKVKSVPVKPQQSPDGPAMQHGCCTILFTCTLPLSGLRGHQVCDLDWGFLPQVRSLQQMNVFCYSRLPGGGFDVTAIFLMEIMTSCSRPNVHMHLFMMSFYALNFRMQKCSWQDFIKSFGPWQPATSSTLHPAAAGEDAWRYATS